MLFWFLDLTLTLSFRRRGKDQTFPPRGGGIQGGVVANPSLIKRGETKLTLLLFVTNPHPNPSLKPHPNPLLFKERERLNFSPSWRGNTRGSCSYSLIDKGSLQPQQKLSLNLKFYLSKRFPGQARE
ncbi:MAG: hypothetical protein LBQ59_02825 [Candidatus Peribacteria bacterium]|nr:hypothetical protein [Candidatus Peribacteria bacterium]